jgi:hypothetical protein
MILRIFFPVSTKPFVKNYGLRHIVFSDEQNIPFKTYVPRIKNIFILSRDVGVFKRSSR